MAGSLISRGGLFSSCSLVYVAGAVDRRVADRTLCVCVLFLAHYYLASQFLRLPLWRGARRTTDRLGGNAIGNTTRRVRCGAVPGQPSKRGRARQGERVSSTRVRFALQARAAWELLDGAVR